MKNIEVVRTYNGLAEIQKKEKEYFEKTGKQLLGGRVKVLYAMKKNMNELLRKSEPYEESRMEILREYRDLDGEENNYKKAQKEYIEKSMVKRGIVPPSREMIYKHGKTEKEMEEKLKELQEIDAGDVQVHKISLKELEGLELSSIELGALMFMIEE